MLTTLTPTAANLVKKWLSTLSALGAAKEAIAAERIARQEVVDHIYSGDTTGTHNYNLGDGYVLKAELGINYALNDKPVDPNDPKGETHLDVALAKIEASGNQGPFIVERLIRWKPELSITEYKSLPPALKTIIDGVITTKPDAPTLKFIEPPKSAQ